MTRALAVWCEQYCVGQLWVSEGRWNFQYASSWLGHPEAFFISPHFQFQDLPFSDTPDDKRVEWFFENLLPEGGMREALARQAFVSAQDTYALLRRYGVECAGALTLPQRPRFTRY